MFLERVIDISKLKIYDFEKFFKNKPINIFSKNYQVFAEVERGLN